MPRSSARIKMIFGLEISLASTEVATATTRKKPNAASFLIMLFGETRERRRKLLEGNTKNKNPNPNTKKTPNLKLQPEALVLFGDLVVEILFGVWALVF